MELSEKRQIETALLKWRKTCDRSDGHIDFRMIRDLGGSGFARIYRIDTNIGEFVAKFALCPNSTSNSESKKTNSTLECEADGLQALARQTQIRIPKVICRPTNECNLLLSEFIPKANPTTEFEAQFGKRLALMHLELAGQRFGWDTDNYLGASTQPNQWNDFWPKFWHTQRMQPQIRLAAQSGSCSDELLGQLDRLADIMLGFMQQQKHRCCLIHGDLWSGNFWADRDGSTVMIDPACYFADPIAELGMISLFGGLGHKFQTAYFENISAPAEVELTIAIYRFYHLLNHLNLFGTNYLTQVQLATSALLKRL